MLYGFVKNSLVFFRLNNIASNVVYIYQRINLLEHLAIQIQSVILGDKEY